MGIKVELTDDWKLIVDGEIFVPMHSWRDLITTRHTFSTQNSLELELGLSKPFIIVLQSYNEKFEYEQQFNLLRVPTSSIVGYEDTHSSYFRRYNYWVASDVYEFLKVFCNSIVGVLPDVGPRNAIDFPELLQKLPKKLPKVVKSRKNKLFFYTDKKLFDMNNKKLFDMYKKRNESSDGKAEIVRGISSREFPVVRNLMKKTFGSMASSEVIEEELNLVNWRISIKLVVNGNIVGMYLFSDSVDDVYSYVEEDSSGENYEPLEDLSPYKNKKGVKGVALLLLPEYRNTGLGKQLIEYPMKYLNGYDYIWGEHLFALGNLGDWTKRRRLVAKSDQYYLTLRDL